MTQVGGISGCLSTNEIDVCYYPFLAIVDMPIYASPLGGQQVGFLSAGDGFCRQSVPQFATSGCTRNLNLRAYEGFNAAWGYANQAGIGGWVYGPALADNNGALGCCGPAQDDYRCGDAKAFVCSPNEPCDGGVNDTGPLRSGVRGINATTYLRYAPGSTAFYYVVPGCTVEEYIRSPANGAWTCVRVVEGAGYALNNIRGWILTSSLA